jgi:hypothetical protein
LILFRDKAIEQADQALQLTREKRLENFAEMLKNILNKSKGKIFLLSK